MNSMKQLFLLLCILFLSLTILSTEKKRNFFTVRLLYRKGNLTTYGSAFFLKQNRKVYLITAAHNVTGRGYLEIYTDKKEPIRFSIKKKFLLKNFDIVVYRIRGDDLPLFNDIGFPRPGKKNIVSVGYPEGKDIGVFIGQMQRITFSTTCPIESGMSGGPVLQNGKVIGVTVAKLVYNNKHHGVHVPLEAIMREVEAQD